MFLKYARIYFNSGLNVHFPVVSYNKKNFDYDINFLTESKNHVLLWLLTEALHFFISKAQYA